MKLCILICGLIRTINLVIENIKKKFLNYDIKIYIVTTLDNDEKNYFNNFDPVNLIKNYDIQDLVFISSKNNSDFKNALNYLEKISLGLKIIKSNYDMYIILRSDCIINNIDFIDKLNSNDLYFSDNNSINNDKLNEHIIITKNIQKLGTLSNIYNYACNNINYTNIILHDYITQNNISFKKITIDYKLILSKCNIIAISGDSGSGKSTIMSKINNIFGIGNVLKLETDRYHKWERGDENYKKYTHLNPEANHLEIMHDDIYNLKIGNEIFQLDYNHDNGKFTQKEKISSRNNIILCGLHTLYVDDINQIVDIKIFMDTDRELIKKWKIKRDTLERNHSREQILKSINNRESDYYKYIDCQKKNADIIINFFEINDNLECKIILKNDNIYYKLIKYLVKYNYVIDGNTVNLKKNCKNIYINENIQKYYQIEDLNDYNSEILILFILYIYY